MNMLKNNNKQGEKILLSGVAAAALGLINAKPQAVKAATLNGNRATKKTTRRTVKTKLNYQTETDSETAGETATADPADQDSGSQTKVSTTTGQDQNSAASTSNNDHDSVSASDNKTATERFNPAEATKAQIKSIWYTVPVAFDKETGIFTISSGKVNVFAVNGNLPDIGIHTSDSDIWSNIKEIDITGQVTLPYSIGLFRDLPKLQKITGLENLVIGDKQHTPATSMAEMFENDPNLTTLEGLNSSNFDTSLVSDMSNMFKGCTALSNLDLSSLNTSNVTTMNNMFDGCDNLTSLNLSSFDTSKVKTMNDMFSSCPNLTKLTLGKNFKFVGSTGLKDLSGTWVNTGVDQDSPAKGTNIWSSDELMTNYQGDKDHDTYARYTAGAVTIHRQDEDGKQLVDQDGKQIPDEKLFGNISNPVTVDTSKEFAGYTFKENKNPDVKEFISDPQDITLVYSKSKTDNTSDNTWEGVPYTFNNGVLSLGVKGINYKIDNSGNKEKSYALDTRDISISQNIKGVNVDEIKEIDLNAPIAIIGSANGVFKNLKNLATIKGLSNLDTSQVTNMEEMFSNCPKLTALDLSSLNTDNVASYSSMFSGDTALISVDLSSFKVAANAEMKDMFSSCSSLTKLALGKDFKFTTLDNQPNNSLQQPGTWVNMGAGEGSPAKGTKKWTSAELMTKYQGSTDHDTYKLFTNLGGIVTVHRRDEQGNQLVPDEELFGNISDPINVDTNITGYTLKENKNPDVKAFTSDPQDITLVYTKKTGTDSQGSESSQSSQGSQGSGNSNPNTSVPNNTNSSSGNNGSVNNPSSSNSQGSNSQGSNTGNSNNNSSSGSNSQNNGNNLPNNEPNNIPSPVNRKPKTVKPHKAFNKGFNIKGKNAIRDQQLANSLDYNGPTSTARTTSDDSLTDPLPQTGNDKHNSLAMLALGSLALATAIGAAWFGRKKD
ncbi:BspA family leucine-rich repeat surface protein [Lactobacillus sp. IBH004]|uniref:BspA family leucine-rich repeat surface protein n=1 Tax=Lactobacillus sp. IBH004 TaxID=2879107 RepID=UPI002243C7FC|nr:BspA family leucine-rich repeat surface protein [Lactobacillus sp. IBH004]UZN42446.1 BspA family leucine-rich repeat surface protein [Lactobacillus sp. IBH004]